MRISMIVAAARNGVIGHEGDLPWRLPDDQAFFRRKTTGQVIVIGRRTWEEIGGPLPGRANYVLTRGEPEPCQGIEFFPDLASAIDAARAAGFEECFIAGGEALYREGSSVADRIYLTRVDAEPPGDTWFPELDETVWECIERVPHPADDRHAHAFTFETWERRDRAGRGEADRDAAGPGGTRRG